VKAYVCVVVDDGDALVGEKESSFEKGAGGAHAREALVASNRGIAHPDRCENALCRFLARVDYYIGKAHWREPTPIRGGPSLRRRNVADLAEPVARRYP
jgi:hypothetical protein